MIYLFIITLVVSICAIILSAILFRLRKKGNKIIENLIVSNNGNVKLISSLNESIIKNTKDIKEVADLISKLSDIVTKLSKRVVIESLQSKPTTTKRKPKTSDK